MSCHLNESGPASSAGECGCSEMRVYSSYSITLNRSSVISPNDPLGGTAYSFKGTFPPFQHRLARSGGQTTYPPSLLRLAHSRRTGAPAAPCSLGTCSDAPACVLSWPDAGMRRSLLATSWWGRGPPPKAGQSPGPCPASLGSELADRATRRAGGGQVRHDCEATRMQAVPSFFFRGLGEAGRDNEGRQKTFTKAHGWEAGWGEGQQLLLQQQSSRWGVGDGGAGM